MNCTLEVAPCCQTARSVGTDLMHGHFALDFNSEKRGAYCMWVRFTGGESWYVVTTQ